MAYGTSAAVSRALARRVTAAERSTVRIEWFINELSNTVALSMFGRVVVATQYLQDKVVRNISRPVTKTYVKRVRDTSKTKTGGPRGSQYTQVNDRSKKGEFPKADTVEMLKSIFSGVDETEKWIYDGFVGSPLEYALILETNENLDRRFLTKTADEERDKIIAILSGPLSAEEYRS